MLAQYTLAIPGLPWLAAVVQLLGLMAAWFTRRSEGSAFQTSCQGLFLAALLLVGLTTVTCIGLGPGYWLCSGATFSVMVLGATCEFTRAAGA